MILLNVLLNSVCQYFTEDFCIDVHHGYWPVAFLFSCVSARFWHQDDVGLIERVTEYSLFLYCLGQFQQEWCQLLFVHLVEFGCEPISWTFFGWQVINCCLNFRPCYWSIQSFNFLAQSWECASVQEFIYFFQIYWFICKELFVVIANGSLYFGGICGDLPFIGFLWHLLDSSLFSFLLVQLAVYCVSFLKTSSWIY